MVRKGVAYVTVNVPQVCLSPGLLVLWCGTAGKGNDAEGDTRQGDTREVALGHCRAFQNAASVCLSGRVATWMDGVRSRHFAKTADPSTSLRYGRDDKGRAVTFRKGGDPDGRGSLYFEKTADPSTSFGDDKSHVRWCERGAPVQSCVV